MSGGKTHDRNLTWDECLIPRAVFEQRLGQKGCVVWFTGLSGAGKSTLARRVEHALFHSGRHCYVLDGDNVRHGLNADLGFSPEARAENIRRVAHVAELFMQAGIITLTAFISPYRADRARARAVVGDERFLEVFVDADVETCAERDTKGLYKRAFAGELKDFTGVSAPYEAPEAAELVLKTGELAVDDCVARTLRLLERGGFIPGEVSP
jgi:adenylyl-sulfate kinase